MKNLNETELKNFISEGNVAIDFWATWCGPCQMLGPVFDDLSKEVTDVKFAKVDIDVAGEAAIELGVRGVPTIILFKDGKEINRIVGFMPKPTLMAKINETFK